METEKEIYQKEREKGREIQICKKEKGQIKQRNLQAYSFEDKVGSEVSTKKTRHLHKY
jgi:hypothetical protein